MRAAVAAGDVCRTAVEQRQPLPTGSDGFIPLLRSRGRLEKTIL